MMLSFISQLAWATACLAIALGIVLGISMRGFLNEHSMEIDRPSQADWHP